jgi:cytochrome P450
MRIIGRALLRPCFSRLQLANFDIYETNFEKLCKLIPRDGSAVDLQQLFKRFTIDTASEILFGESVNSLSDEASSKEVSAAFDKGSQGIFERGNMGIFLWMHWDPKFTRSCKIVHNYIGKFIDKAIQLRNSSKIVEVEGSTASGRKRYIFLEELAKDTSDRKLLRDQITGALAAGRDTTASLLSFTLWLLVRHPQTLQTLRMEVAKLEGKLPSYEQLQSMNYLQWVLNESELA